MKIKANDICGSRGEKCYSSIFVGSRCSFKKIYLSLNAAEQVTFL